jgi:DNA modification methylase
MAIDGFCLVRSYMNKEPPLQRRRPRPPEIRVQQVEHRDPQSLRNNPRNARTHSRRQLRQLINSVRTNGFIGAVIIDETDTILAGHARNDAAKELGIPAVPTFRVTGLSEAQKRAFVLADNKIAANAGWDLALLKTELGELAELLPLNNLDLSITGFEAAEIDNLLLDGDDTAPDPSDQLPTLRQQSVSRIGDLWLLRQHRLLCGDARSQADLDRLAGGAQARMAFLDPPYNVRIAGVVGRGRTKHAEFACASGEMDEAEYNAFLVATLGNAARISANGCIHYVCIDWRHIADLIAAGRTAYDAMLNLCVWDKINPGQGSLYRSRHELIGVFRVGSEPHQNNIELGRLGRNRSNIWPYPGVNGFGAERAKLRRAHPTPKPVTLIADAMRDCTTKGDTVLDTFVGSGSTIMAAEKVGRHACGLELEPRYVDVSIRRWEAYTKAEAILAGDGRTFADIEVERLGAEDGADTDLANHPEPLAEYDASRDHKHVEADRAEFRPKAARSPKKGIK